MSARKPSRRKDIVIESLPDGSAVLYDDRQKTAFPITSTGAAIWNACDGTRSVDAIVTELVELYEATRATIERDVDAFLQQLDKMQLLEESGSGGA